MSEETRSPHPPKVAKAQEGPGPYVAVVKNHPAQTEATAYHSVVCMI